MGTLPTFKAKLIDRLLTDRGYDGLAKTMTDGRLAGQFWREIGETISERSGEEVTGQTLINWARAMGIHDLEPVEAGAA